MDSVKALRRRWGRGFGVGDHSALARDCAAVMGSVVGRSGMALRPSGGDPFPDGVDHWTAWAMPAHLAESHGGATTATGARRFLDAFKDVVRWRIRTEALRTAEDWGFHVADHPCDYALVADRARTWVGRLSEARSAGRHEVTRTRTGFAVWAPGIGREGMRRFFAGPVWEGPDMASTQVFLHSLAAHDALRRDWRARDAASGPVPTHVAGVTMWAFKGVGEDEAAVTLECDGRVVGRFSVQPADMAPCHARGGPGLSASRQLDDAYTRCGFGESMHALCESTFGLPLVPHGVNGQGGMLTEPSRRYYAKRLAKGVEDGFEAASRARYAEMATRMAWRQAVNGLPDHERDDVLTQLRDAVGGTLEYARDPLDGWRRLVWLAIPGGDVLTQAGRFPRTGLLDALRAEDPDIVIRETELVRHHRPGGLATAIANRVLYGIGASDREPGPPPVHREAHRSLELWDSVVRDGEALAASMAPTFA